MKIDEKDTGELIISENIKKYRLNRGLTQKELAGKCSLSESSIKSYEAGIRKPKIEALEKISMVFEVSVNELLGIQDKVESNINSNIKRYRKNIGMLPSELAKRINVSPAYITMLESGKKRNPSLEALIKISEVLEVTLDELVGNDAHNKIKAKQLQDYSTDELLEEIKRRIDE